MADLYCTQCSVVIGWHYLEAHEQDQKYKEGKYIIEKSYLKPIGLNAPQKDPVANADDDSDSDGASNFVRLLAATRAGNRPFSASGLNLQ